MQYVKVLNASPGSEEAEILSSFMGMESGNFPTLLLLKYRKIVFLYTYTSTRYLVLDLKKNIINKYCNQFYRSGSGIRNPVIF
jgi:hypothetical protein